MTRYGLIGCPLGHSFSKKYFTEKFSNEHIDAIYENYELYTIEDFLKLPEDIQGLNVTIPYKKEIIPYLDELSEEAKQIGAINTIQFKNGKKIGHNTDWFGFIKSIFHYIRPYYTKALILGTGGASNAIEYALNRLEIESKKVSRNGDFTYKDLTSLEEYDIIINCTPLGTYPNIEECPDIPYHTIDYHHLCYDLVYNPEKTEFLKRCELQGATILNGYDMLINQAEKSFEIWNS